MGTHYHGSAGERRALDAYIKLTRAAESVTQRVNRHLGGAGLTMTQFGVLEALHHLGPMCQSELAGKLLRSPGNLTLVVDNLERAGLVERRRQPTDRRYVDVHLTAEGEAVIGPVFQHHVREVVREMGALSDEELEALGALCRKLGKGIEKGTEG